LQTDLILGNVYVGCLRSSPRFGMLGSILDLISTSSLKTINTLIYTPEPGLRLPRQAQKHENLDPSYLPKIPNGKFVL